MANNEIVFDVVEEIGTITNYSTGWKKEVNLISWNNGPAKVDIRDWDPGHLHMSKGITLHDDEARKLLMLLKRHYASNGPRQRYGPKAPKKQYGQNAAEQNVSQEAAEEPKPAEALEANELQEGFAEVQPQASQVAESAPIMESDLAE